MTEAIKMEMPDTNGVKHTNELIALQAKLREKMRAVMDGIFKMLQEHQSVDVVVRKGGLTDKEKIEALLSDIGVKYSCEPEIDGSLWIRMRNGNSLMVEFDEKGKVRQ